MRCADKALEDEALLLIIQQELAKRCKKSRTRGRPATSAAVVLRMMLLQHVRDGSYADLTREVRANLVYRTSTGIGGDQVPEDKTMRWLGRQSTRQAANYGIGRARYNCACWRWRALAATGPKRASRN